MAYDQLAETSHLAIVHDDPQPCSNEEGAIVPYDLWRRAMCEDGNFFANLVDALGVHVQVDDLYGDELSRGDALSACMMALAFQGA